MFAWTLNTNAENAASSGRGSSLTSTRGDGGGARSTMASRIMRTPKFVSAEPTNSGVESPARNDVEVEVGTDGVEQAELVLGGGPRRALLGGRDVGRHELLRGESEAPRSVRVKRMYSPLRRSTTPRRSPAMPTGQVTGVGRRPIWASISSRSSSGSRPGRSYLLRNVSTGSRRARQTSNSLSVWDSMPLAVSSTMTTASTPASTRYVSSEKSRWPGVSSRLMTWSRYGNWSTVELIEMPRWRSSSIQSDVAERRPSRALTAPARCTAPA